MGHTWLGLMATQRHVRHENNGINNKTITDGVIYLNMMNVSLSENNEIISVEMEKCCKYNLKKITIQLYYEESFEFNVFTGFKLFIDIINRQKGHVTSLTSNMNV